MVLVGFGVGLRVVTLGFGLGCWVAGRVVVFLGAGLLTCTVGLAGVRDDVGAAAEVTGAASGATAAVGAGLGSAGGSEKTPMRTVPPQHRATRAPRLIPTTFHGFLRGGCGAAGWFQAGDVTGSGWGCTVPLRDQPCGPGWGDSAGSGV